MAERLSELTTGDVIQVELDEIFRPANPHRPHRFHMLVEIEAWLADPAIPGGYVHRERKMRHNNLENIYYTNEEMEHERYQHAQVSFPVVGYRHRFSFTDKDAAFAFKMRFGGALVTLGEWSR